MLENPSDPSANPLPAPIKRYAPPNQRSLSPFFLSFLGSSCVFVIDRLILLSSPPFACRNRGLNRRKSGDRSDRTSNLLASDGEKNLSTGSQSALSIDHSDTGSSNFVYDIRPRLIALKGCYRSEASRLLHERVWPPPISDVIFGMEVKYEQCGKILGV